MIRVLTLPLYERPFRVSTEIGPSGRVRVRVSGDVDTGTAPALRAALEAAADRPVDVDLAAVTFFSAAGLGALMAVRRDTAEVVSLVAASRPVRRVLAASGVDWPTPPCHA